MNPERDHEEYTSLKLSTDNGQVTLKVYEVISWITSITTTYNTRNYRRICLLSGQLKVLSKIISENLAEQMNEMNSNRILDGTDLLKMHYSS